MCSYISYNLSFMTPQRPNLFIVFWSLYNYTHTKKAHPNTQANHESVFSQWISIELLTNNCQNRNLWPEISFGEYNIGTVENFFPPNRLARSLGCQDIYTVLYSTSLCPPFPCRFKVFTFLPLINNWCSKAVQNCSSSEISIYAFLATFTSI